MTNKSTCFILIAFFCFFSCSDSNEQKRVVFLGDSHVSRWDTEHFFPNYRTQNLGVSGMKIGEIEERLAMFNLVGSTVIIQIGNLPEGGTLKSIHQSGN